VSASVGVNSENIFGLSKMKKKTAALVALFFFLQCTQALWGELFFFSGGGEDNLWTNEENWNPGGVPGELGADVVVARSANGKRALIDDTMEISVDFLTMWGGTDEQIPDGFDMTGGELELAGPSGLLEMGSNEVNIPIEVNMNSGLIIARNSYLGGRQTGGGTPPIDSDAIFNVSGDSEIQISGFLQVGHDHPDAFESMGTLNLSDAANMTLGSLIISGAENGLITISDDAQLMIQGDVVFEIEDHILLDRIIGADLEVEYLDDLDQTMIVSTGAALSGDFDDSGALGVADVNLLIEAIIGNGDNSFDLSNDGVVDQADLTVWVKEFRRTWIGDANLDGEFNSGDFVSVFQAGKFEQDLSAGWEEGDWNGDARFNTSDFVIAFQDGGFERGPILGVRAIPEPNSMILISFSIFLIHTRLRQKNRVSDVSSFRTG